DGLNVGHLRREGQRHLVAGLAVALVVLFLCSLRDNKRLALYTGTILLGGVLALGGLFLMRESAFVKESTILNRLTDIRTTSSTAQSRFMIWGIARQAFAERPILGWGPGNFIIPYAKYYDPNLFGNEPWFDHVHNMHFEWLVAGGVIGFAAYLSVLFGSIYALWRLWRDHVLDGAAIAVIAGFFVAYLGQNTFVFDTIITYLFFVLFLALLHGLSSQSSTEQKQIGNMLPPSTSAVIAPLFIVAGILCASIAHSGQMQVAKGIITMLNSAATGSTALDVTRQLDEIKRKNTFGTSEARERFTDLLFSVVRQRDKISSSDLLFLISRGVEEMKEEAARNPENVKPVISLGKLLQLRFALTGSHVDRDKAIAAYESAIAHAPLYPAATIGLAEVYLTAGDTARASELMNAIFQK
ncbi:MAG: O-antigen ligase family protein, partial [Patescibacteria group bacterium]